ncbi:hypothetical protein C8R44DRAFT_985587 [Mycena epipterygia]|nr:hypothetical protein C8R44DRAFT_985587 [Mycena epipterygia]
MNILDLGLWMNISAAVVTALYRIAVLVLSARTRDLPPYAILTSVPTAGCASVLVFAWLAAFALTLLVPVAAPPPLIDMAVPFEVALGVLTGVEMLVVVVITRLSAYPHPVAPESSRLIALRPSSTRRLLSFVHAVRTLLVASWALHDVRCRAINALRSSLVLTFAPRAPHKLLASHTVMGYLWTGWSDE